MDAATLQTRIYGGYAKAAQRIGESYSVYRSISAINPLDSGYLYSNVLASFNVDWAYSKANKFGNALWQLIADGTPLQVFDYLVSEQSTFYVAAMQSLLPMLAIETNRTLTIKRPTQPTGKGSVGYGGYQDSTATLLMQNCPASVLEGTKGETSTAKLPSDTKMPWWRVLMPFLGGVILETGDIIVDDLGARSIISSVECTDMGYRLTTGELGT